MSAAYDKLLNSIAKKATKLCIGLDSDVSKLPLHIAKEPEGLLEFNAAIIDATKEYASAYKMNFAFYEQYGVKGFEILKKTFEMIPDDIFTIADAKRGDIGNTSKAYAKSIFEHFNADSITVSPYMGYDSVMPFLEFRDKFVFLLALTSNKGAHDFQKIISNSNEFIYSEVIKKSGAWAGKENLGFVIGATHPGELANLRESSLDRVFLIPGVGAQGGDVHALVNANGEGPALINSSRAVIYASDGKDYAERSADIAKNYTKTF